jgi:hypothetical protein
VPNDGTTIGAKAAAKAKLSLKAGNTTVVVESDLDDEQAKAFLAQRHQRPWRRSARTWADKPVKFYVPSGHKKFARASQTGAFVYYGDSTVYVNPRMASGDQHARSARGARRPLHARRQVRLHRRVHADPRAGPRRRWPEPPHPADGRLSPTDSQGFTAQSRRDHRAAALGHSKYGKENPAEGYAEAFAQWTLEGKGSSASADHYAERFGWAEPPAAHTADRKALLANKARVTQMSKDIEARKIRELTMTEDQKVAEAAKRNGLTVSQQREKDADAKALLSGRMSHAEYTAKWPAARRAADGASVVTSSRRVNIAGRPVSTGSQKFDADITKALDEGRMSLRQAKRVQEARAARKGR